MLIANKNEGVLLTALNLRKSIFKPKTTQQVPVNETGKLMKESFFI